MLPRLARGRRFENSARPDLGSVHTQTIFASRPDGESLHTRSMVELQAIDLAVWVQFPRVQPTLSRLARGDRNTMMRTFERDLRLEILNSLLTTPHRQLEQ